MLREAPVTAHLIAETVVVRAASLEDERGHVSRIAGRRDGARAESSRLAPPKDTSFQRCRKCERETPGCLGVQLGCITPTAFRTPRDRNIGTVRHDDCARARQDEMNLETHAALLDLSGYAGRRGTGAHLQGPKRLSLRAHAPHWHARFIQTPEQQSASDTQYAPGSGWHRHTAPPSSATERRPGQHWS